MTSLSEVYHDGARGLPSSRRLYAGTAFLLGGAGLAVLALVVGTTDLVTAQVGGELAARELAGILGGLAVPSVLVGVFTVLPSGRRTRAAAAISASICLLGVALFWYAYPTHWAGYNRDLTFFVSAVYLVGLFSAVWCLFTAIANFKTRNDPGGALEMNVTRRGETKVVEADSGSSGLGSLGGVGFLGSTPDGDVETQTNQPGGDGSGRSATGRAAAGRAAATGPDPGGPSPAGDGGTATGDISSPLDGGANSGPQAGTTRSADAGAPPNATTNGDGRDAVVIGDSTTPAEPADRYCGNCRHFEYVRDSDGMVPYCRQHGERMDDMDACEEWTPNANR